jgi:hypothetical protein
MSGILMLLVYAMFAQAGLEMTLTLEQTAQHKW